MTRVIFLLSILFALNSLAQEQFSEENAKALIDTFFEGFHAGDTLQMKSVLAENVSLLTAHTNSDGKPSLSDGTIDDLLKAIANRPSDQKWEEKLLDYSVQIDGNLAHVWTPYEFWLNGNFSHCGSNAFTLAKLPDGWKIIHLIDSRRREDCK
ncbi:nuclear transport factor 2 family protein [Luteirhabdus pelagi]|uniref:nuclear transport factor 2 family protein n=1 Tax=Luteirhabdus pelagi TaxID=2792783 RepID=UPI0019396D11|nr:nuclear transport factor 2 family protein [Luteirhabdus pelagi]